MTKKNFPLAYAITSDTAQQISIFAITGTLLLNGFLPGGVIEDLLQP